MNEERQELFNAIHEGLGIAPPTQGQMDDFITALNKNGLKLVSKDYQKIIPELAIKLLNDCQDIFNEMDAISWNEESDWQGSSYDSVADSVSKFLEKNTCNCEPFQSCEECKTEYLPISEMKECGINYWLLDPENVIGRGFLTPQNKIIYDQEYTPEEFDKPVMFAEIKPPEPPR